MSWKSGSSRILALIPMLWLATSAAMVDAGTESAIQRIEIEDGLITLVTRDAPLPEVIQAIGERVGFETLVAGEVAVTVNVSYNREPVQEVLDELLANANQIVVYAPGTEETGESEIRRIWLLESTDVVGSGQIAPGSQDEFPGLRQTDDNARSLAVLRLANEAPTPEVMQALSDALSDDRSALVRTRAAMALGNHRDERAVPALEAALYDTNRTVRVQSINALAQIGGERATEALGDILLNGTDTNQRVVAAWGLGKQETNLAQQFLDVAANDPNEQVRKASTSPPTTAKSSASPTQNAGPAGETQ